jgi:cell division protein FtsN
VTIEKRFLEKAYLNFSYEQNYKTGLRLGEVGIRYDFSFAQTGFSARQSDQRTTLIQYARGSFINDRATHYFSPDNRTNVGRGGISIIAFLDLNANGNRDKGEPLVNGLNVHSNGGRVEHSEKDSAIHILGLEPYTKYFIEIDEKGFENISWRIANKSIAVIVDPNMLKLVEVPVYVRGEITGMIMLEEEGSRKGLSRIIVNIHNENNTIYGRALTEEDGYFSYFGLVPGKYHARIDTAQLRRLKMISVPDSVPFDITASTEGDYVEGIDFTLKKILPPADTSVIPVPAGPAEQKDTTYMVVHEVIRELVTITEDYYAVQFGAFQNKAYAEIMRNKVQGALDKQVELFEEDGFWKVRITGFADRGDLDSYIPVIQAQGINQIWVIMNRAVKQDYRTTVREDSVARIRETVTERAEPVNITGTTVQLGVFNQSEESTAIIDRLLAASEKLVTLKNEDGVFKVQVELADTNEVREFLPVLQKYGFDNIVIIPAPGAEIITVRPAEPEVAVEEPEAVVAEPEKVVAEPEVIEEAPVVLPPRFLLHAASYFKRSQAERAKNKIERRLKLPVEILVEWNTYRVVITGFYNREETYPYYPELAGMGFSDVFVIERPAENK